MSQQRKPVERPIQPFHRISVPQDVFEAIVAPRKINVHAASFRLDKRWDIIISGSLQDVIDSARKPGERSADVLKRIVKQ